jgi:hypothetical protein
MIAIVLLTVNPSDSLIKFYSSMRDDGHDVYIISDQSNSACSRFGVTFVTVDDCDCIREGFTLFNPAIIKDGKPADCSAWEKALYYFSHFNRSYEHVWLIEDDVFIPREDLISDIDRRYINQDLLSQTNIKIYDGQSSEWYWWSQFPHDIFPRPWASSMVCAVRLSSRLLESISIFVNEYKESNKFIEYIFHTIALHNNFIVEPIPELSNVVWRRDWCDSDFHLNGFFHPVKTVLEQERVRSLLFNPGAVSLEGDCRIIFEASEENGRKQK